jgi:alpha-D-ribose 1-methylphosphonate 5-triphosphate diphosphatase PhnM
LGYRAKAQWRVEKLIAMRMARSLFNREEAILSCRRAAAVGLIDRGVLRPGSAADITAREKAQAVPREAESTDAPERSGLPRSSDEAG